MSEKSLKLVNEVRKVRTQFGDVLSSIAAEKKFNQRELAAELGCSPSTLSLVGSGDRGLSLHLAEGIAAVLGGTADVWSKIYDETKRGTALSVGYFRGLIVETGPIDSLPGSRVRRLRRTHMEMLLKQPDQAQADANARSVFRIDPYDSSRIRETSFDTSFGAIKRSGETRSSSVEGSFQVEPGQSIIARTREAITLPLWMEAEVHPAASLAKRHLIVSGGPIIDPGFDDFLSAAVFNPTADPIAISTDEPFLTLRFWIQELD